MLAAVLMQESRYRLNATRKQCGYDSEDNTTERCITTDFGISQVHYKNLKRFKLDKDRLLVDLNYSVDAGAKIMRTYVTFATNEPKTWICRYNKGTAPFYKIQEGCVAYLKYIQKYY